MAVCELPAQLRITKIPRMRVVVVLVSLWVTAWIQRKSRPAMDNTYSDSDAYVSSKRTRGLSGAFLDVCLVAKHYASMTCYHICIQSRQGCQPHKTRDMPNPEIFCLHRVSHSIVAIEQTSERMLWRCITTVLGVATADTELVWNIRMGIIRGVGSVHSGDLHLGTFHKVLLWRKKVHRRLIAFEVSPKKKHVSTPCHGAYESEEMSRASRQRFG
jgi:hypothetical protein